MAPLTVSLTGFRAESSSRRMAGPECKRSQGAILSLLSILLLAFSVRVVWRIHMGSTDFWENGYSFFYDMAGNIVSGKGLFVGGAWAMRTPLYPLFLALTTLGGKNYLWIVVPQALIGTGTVLCAFLIGKRLFGQATGILASLLTALYPYYVVHDTALQDTSLFTFLTALAVFLLLRTNRNVTEWALTGVILGVAVLTRPTIAPFALGALLWIAACGEGPGRRRVYRVLIVLVPLSLMVGPWLLRNYLLLGSPVLTSELGRQLWVGNNKETFAHYPRGSIDRSTEQAFTGLTPAERADLQTLSPNEVNASDWFLKKGLDYMRTHPLETIRGAGQKIAAGFSWRLNPAREPAVQAIYLASYAPISILGALGMALTWRRWREYLPIYILFLAFGGVSAVFWAHSSHRSYLDVYLIVFTASLLQRVIGRFISPLPVSTRSSDMTDRESGGSLSSEETPLRA